MQRPSVSDLIKTINAKNGNVSAVARAYQRPRSTVQDWIDASVTATQALEDARETRVDVAETVVFKRAAEENLQAAFYILNNDPRAKKRGWGPRQEVTGAGGGPLQHEINDMTDRERHERIRAILAEADETATDRDN